MEILAIVVKDDPDRRLKRLEVLVHELLNARRLLPAPQTFQEERKAIDDLHIPSVSHLLLTHRACESSLPSMRILIAEDQKKMAGFLKKGLTENGYAVDVTESGATAEVLASENEYDLV